jgi:hypothetical protein
VAGIAAGRTVTFNDGGTTRTFSGVAPYANVIAIKVFHRVNTSTVCGSSTPCVRTWESDWILGLERVYALRNTYSIAAANMSLGGGGYTTNCTGPTSSIVSTLRSAGIATVIAAGNNSYINGTSYPACIADAINVGSTNSNDVVSSFSNAANFMNMWAPGGSILSSRAGTYQYLGGTSMAAPHVAGAWAVLKQRFPGTSVTGILNQITSTGVPVKDNRGGGTVTKPRLQLDNALYGRSGGMTNSLRSNAKIIPDGTVYSAGQTMNGSLKAIDDPVPSCQSSFDNTVWYRITPSVSGSTTISTLYSNFDTVIAVYVGSTQVACNDDYSGSLTSQVTLNMTAGTTYEIMIAKYGSAFASNVNGTLELQVIRTAHKPTQIGPSGLYTVSLSPIYRWNALPGATAYQVYVYDFVTGSVPVNATYTASNICIAGTCSVNAGVNLVSNRSYAWWVAARYDIYSTAAWGPWSNGLNFIPSIAPGKPTTITPTGIITGTLTPAYRWSDVGGAVSYALLVYDMETFAVKIFTSYTASSICSAGFCQVTPTGSANTLINGRAYGWFVAALSYAGASQWSDGKVFIPFVTPSAPTLISPTGTATNPVTYRWNKVQGVTAYYVLVLRSTGTQYVGTWVSATSVCGATTCQYTPGGSLPVGTYFWWVASGNPAGTSGYSSSLAFSITSAPSPAPTFEPAQDFNP